jgi:hypothetical protein
MFFLISPFGKTQKSMNSRLKRARWGSIRIGALDLSSVVGSHG